MGLSQTDLLLIVANSANLAERLREEYTPRGGQEKIAERRLSRWKTITAENAFCGLERNSDTQGNARSSEAGLLALFGPVVYRPDLPLPAWAALLAEMSKFVACSPITIQGGTALNELRGGGRRIPYAHLFQPMSEFASKLAFDGDLRMSALLSPTARRGLRMHLMQRMSSILARAMHLSLMAHQAFHQPGTGLLFPRLPQANNAGDARDGYARFVHEHARDGLRTIFLRYPVAARLIAEVTRQWIGFVQEFLTRYKNDRGHMASCLGIKSIATGKIAAIKAGVSDPHHEGRSVLILTFQNRARVVYKPRSMKIDAAFFDLVAELNRRNRAPDLRVMKILARDDYGWMEFAHHAPCQDQRAAQRFYRRSGALAYLLHWLRGIDFHRENMVAAGEHPVVIDLEALAHPERPEEQAPRAPHSFGCLAQSVLRTGLLPLWQTRFEDLTLYDESALGAPITQRGLFRSARWRQINTDQMRLDFGLRSRSQATHRPSLKSRTLFLKDYEKDVLCGYRQMETLLSSPERGFRAWRDAIVGTSRRQILRPTMAYGVLLRKSLQPEFLTNGVDRSIELRALPCKAGNEQEWTAEIASLEKLDIPYFTLNFQGSPYPPGWLAAVSPQTDAVRLSIRGKLVLKGEQVCRKADRRTNRRKGLTQHQVVG